MIPVSAAIVEFTSSKERTPTEVGNTAIVVGSPVGGVSRTSGGVVVVAVEPLGEAVVPPAAEVFNDGSGALALLQPTNKRAIKKGSVVFILILPYTVEEWPLWQTTLSY